MTSYVILFLILFSSLCMVMPQVYAETIVIIGSEDAYVDEDAADENFGQEDSLFSGWTNPSELNKFNLKEATSYIKFDLAKIPKTNIWTTVSINSANLNISTERAYGDAEIFLIDIYHCNNNSWLEDEITWNNRSCKETTGSNYYSEYVTPIDLPKKHNWNISKIVQDSIASNNSEMTLIIKMNTKQLPKIGDAYDRESEFVSSLVHFSSSETDISGNSVSPKLIVSYSTTSLTQSVYFDIFIAFTFFITGIILDKKGTIVMDFIKTYLKKR